MHWLSETKWIFFYVCARYGIKVIFPEGNERHTLAGVPSLYLPKRLNYASSEKYLMVRTI